MMKKWSQVLMAGSLAATAAVAGQDGGTASAPVMEMPKPTPELAQLQFFEGNWRCQGTQPAMRSKPAIPFKSSMKFSRQLGGHWFSAAYQQETSLPEILGMDALGYWGYDTTVKAFVMVASDNAGGFTQASSPGWKGDEFVWTGEIHGGGHKIPFRRVLTRTGEKAFKARWQYHLPNGQWRDGDEDRCTR
jgi:hypothetical protein